MIDNIGSLHFDNDICKKCDCADVEVKRLWSSNGMIEQSVYCKHWELCERMFAEGRNGGAAR